MRAAPADSGSSPGYLTMVRCSVRSLGKPRTVFEKPSWKGVKEGRVRERRVTHELERRFTATRQLQVPQVRARRNERSEEVPAVVHRVQGKRNLELRQLLHALQETRHRLSGDLARLHGVAERDGAEMGVDVGQGLELLECTREGGDVVEHVRIEGREVCRLDDESGESEGL